MSIRTKIITATAASILGALLLSGVAVAYTGIPQGFTFTRNLPVGTVHQDVVYLKEILKAEGCGVGITNTTYYGPKTKANVQCFQNKYKSQISAYAGYQIGATGFVGTGTRAMLNALLAGTTPTTPTTPSAGLTVALAADNPASGTIVDGQALYPLAKITFTNGDSSEVKVTGLKLKRIGVSADASLNNTYLFDGATRLTDGAAVSSTVITFNDTAGLFTVPAGGSKTITVSADVNGTSGETFGIQVVASTDVTTNASSVKGNFPITGNLHTLASGTLAGVNFNATTTPSAANVDPQDDYTVWQNSVVVTTRAVNMTRISFRKTGSVANTDLQNFRLYVDGVQVGSTIANLDAKGYVTFDLTSAPQRLEAGTRVIKLLANIVGGSSLNFTFHLWNVADVTVVDTQYGANVLPQSESTTFSKRSSGEQSVNSGVITFTKMADSPTGNIVNSASNALLAKFQVKAAGEKIKVESLKVSLVCSDSDVSYLRNGMLLANGVQIGSTSNLKCTNQSTPYTSFSLGSSLIVEPGNPVTLEVKADIYDNDGTNDIDAGDTLKARIEGSSSENNAIGQVSAATIDAPSSDVDGNTLTVATGGLTLSKYTAYTNQSMVPPLTAAKIAHFTLTANTTEAVNINTIQINLNNVISSYASNLYVKFGDQTTTVKPSISAYQNSWSVNYTLAAGQTKDLIVYADINSSASGTGTVGAYITGTTASSATSVTAGGSTTTDSGQSIAFTTGTFTPAVDGSTPLAAIVAGGQQVVAGRFKFTTLYENYTLKEVRFTLGAAARSAAINNLILKDGDTVLATVPYDNTNEYFNITGLNVSIPANTTKVLSVVYDLSSSISSSTSTSQVDVQPTLAYVKYADSQGVETTSSTTYSTNKEVYVFKSIPTVSKVAVTTSTLSNQTVDLYSWKIAADAKGPIAVKQVKLDLTWRDTSGDSTLYLYAFKLYKDGNDISSLVTITDEDGHNLETTTAASGANEDSSKVIIYWATEDTISAGSSATYVLRATASGFAATANKTADDGVSINLAGDTTVNGATVKYINETANTPGGYIALVTSTGGSSTDANFIWSDVSALSHLYTTASTGSTPTSSGDWANGYLVKDLPLSSTTWVGP